MRTASFFTYRGPGRVSIARSAPRGLAGFRMFRALAPGPWFNSVTPTQYRDRFFGEILRPLDPQQTWDRLHELVGNDAPPFLLCWERPPFTATNWCHRRLVAEWFEDKLGHVVEEYDPTQSTFHPAKRQGDLLDGF